LLKKGNIERIIVASQECFLTNLSKFNFNFFRFPIPLGAEGIVFKN